MKKILQKRSIYFAIAVILLGTVGCTRLLFREALVHQIGEQPVLIRGSQPDAKAINDLVAKYGIKTIINLRGESEEDWYLEEKEAAVKHGVNLVNISMNSRKPLQEDQVQTFLQTVSSPDNWPVFTHCHGGSHRTGAMVVVYRKQFQHWDNEKAIAELKDYSFNVGWEKRQKILTDISSFKPKSKFAITNQKTENQTIQNLLSKYNNPRFIPLSEKALFFQEELQSHLKISQETSVLTYENSSYLSLYLASEVFRFMVTLDENARKNIEEILKLITSRKEEYQSLFDYSYLIFGYGILHHFIGNKLSINEMKLLQDDCNRVVEKLLACNFALKNSSISQKLMILSVIATITQNSRVLEEYRKEAIDKAYLFQNLQPVWKQNYRYDMVIVCNLYLLYLLQKEDYQYQPQIFSFCLSEQNINLREIYQKSLKKVMSYQVKQQNTLVNFLYYACNNSGFSKRETILASIKKLEEIPLERFISKHETTLSPHVVPIDERPASLFCWEQSPFLANIPITNSPQEKVYAIDFLLPYWIARYYLFIAKDM